MRSTRQETGRARLLLAVALVASLAGASADRLAAQTMPSRVYFDLGNAGHEKLAKRISDRLELRAGPDVDDVTSLLARWEREAGGPDGGWDWIAVTRLWIRAGDAARGEQALRRAAESGDVPESVLLLDQARLAFLSGDPDLGASAYWKGCSGASEATSLDYWLDVEVLATPAEMEAWDRLRRMPLPSQDLCGFLNRFWGERAMGSALPIPARMSQHYTRLRYALDHYRRRGAKKGPTFSNELGRPRDAAFDDRGLLYVRMGTPDRVASFAGNPSIKSDVVSAECYQPNESWAYDRPGGTRVYHFSAFGGTDDYWLINNLGLVYRCGDPQAGSSGNVAVARLTPINEHRSVPIGRAASLVLPDLYRSRQGLDPWYAQAAQRMYDPTAEITLNVSGSKALESTKVLQEEREITSADGAFAISSVPDQPEVATNARLLVEELQFRGARAGETRVWINALVEAEELAPVAEPDGSFRYRIDARWALIDEAGEYRRFQSTAEARSARRLGRDESLPVRLAADLPAGRYRHTFVVRDQARARSDRAPAGNYRSSVITVRRFDLAVPELSDVAVAPDSGGDWSPDGVSRPENGIRPSPAHQTGGGGTAWVYFETYGLTPGAGYTTLVRVTPVAAGADAFELSFPGDVPLEAGPRLRRTLRLDLADTKPGRYRLSFTVKDGETGRNTLPYETEIVVRGRG
ncbi:MAG: hypothetical protein R6X22_06165 [Gemmatimonadota bacterium]